MKYYTEGTIKEIVLDGSGIKFTLAPADKFCIERGEMKGILFIEEGEKSVWNVRAETMESFFTGGKIGVEALLQIKRDHLPIRVYVEDGKMEVKRLEIKG